MQRSYSYLMKSIDSFSIHYVDTFKKIQIYILDIEFFNIIYVYFFYVYFKSSFWKLQENRHYTLCPSDEHSVVSNVCALSKSLIVQ